MRRLFWLALGVTFGALAFRKLSKMAQKMTPSGMVQSLTESLADLADTVRDFAADVREGMAEHEAVLRAGVGLDSASAAAPQDDPSAGRPAP